MDLIVTISGRTERVRVHRTADGYEIGVGEAAYRMDVLPIGDHRYSLLHDDGRQFDVSILPERDGGYRIGTRRGTVTASVTDPLTHLAEQGGPGGGRRRVETVDAYMPGRVVAILVEEGEEVTAGQGLIVLEAMKMENEIQAEHDGVVRRIRVEEGQAVEGGDALLELE